jgi:uncharacterized protein DUF6249
MQGPEVVILLMVAAAAVIIIWSLSFRYKRQELRHKERMAALEKGAQIPDEPLEKPPVPWSPRVYLLRGLVWLFSGIGLGIFLLGLSVSIGNRPQTYEDRLWRANQLRREGVPEEQLKEFLNSKEPVRREFPEGVSLIGLIPIGVGLAYIIYYRGEEKKPV